MSADPLEQALEGVHAAARLSRYAQIVAEQEATEWERRYEKERKKVVDLRSQVRELQEMSRNGVAFSTEKDTYGLRLPPRRSTVPISSNTSTLVHNTHVYAPFMQRGARISGDSESSSVGAGSLSSWASALAAWALLAGATKLPLSDDQPYHHHHDHDHHTRADHQDGDHSTISVAGDGHSGVGTTAAAATAVALAQSWTGIAGRTSTCINEASACVNHGKARFKLVAAVPRNLNRQRTTAASTSQSTSPSRPGVPADHQTAPATPMSPPLGVSPSRQGFNGIPQNGFSATGMALESIDADPQGLDDSQEAEWRACGSHLKLLWLSAPHTVLVIYKPAADVIEATGRAIAWLLHKGIAVYVEPQAFERARTAAHAVLASQYASLDSNSNFNSGDRTLSMGSSVFGALEPLTLSCEMFAEAEEAARGAVADSALDADDLLARLLLTWPTPSNDTCDSNIPLDIGCIFDLVLTLGGDGTVLWACSLFGNNAVPPVVPLAMGSLGFMTPFPLSRMDSVLARTTSVAHGFPLMLRHRLHCRIVRGGEGAASTPDMASLQDTLYSAPNLNGPVCGEEVVVLNEVVIDRGPVASLANLQCYVDRNFVTTIQGDGLIIATPTGSTAYNLAAGGSMVHPAVPCILFTPICAHTLSSRPLVFPEHVTLRVKVPSDSRSEAYCSFDGRGRKELRPGDSIIIHISQWPVPMVCNLDSSHDWFLSVREGLSWNRRVPQKPL